MNAAIAQHFNVSESAVIRVEEWAHCLFAIVKGIGARFVSKKVVKVAEPELQPVLDSTKRAIKFFEKHKERFGLEYAVKELRRFQESGRNAANRDARNDVAFIDRFIAQYK